MLRLTITQKLVDFILPRVLSPFFSSLRTLTSPSDASLAIRYGSTNCFGVSSFLNASHILRARSFPSAAARLNYMSPCLVLDAPVSSGIHEAEMVLRFGASLLGCLAVSTRPHILGYLSLPHRVILEEFH